MIGWIPGGASANGFVSGGNVNRIPSVGSPLIRIDGKMTAGFPFTITFFTACFSTCFL